MAGATRDYELRLSVGQLSQYTAAIDAAMAKLTAFDALTTQVETKLKGFGSSVSGVNDLAAALNQLTAAMTANSTATNANGAAAARAATAAARAAAALQKKAAAAAAAANAIQGTTRNVAALISGCQAVTGHAGQTAGALLNLGATAKQMNSELGDGEEKSNGLAASFGRLVTAAVAIRAAVFVIQELRDALKEAREHAEKITEEKLDDDHKLRRLASLMGEDDVNDKVRGRVHSVMNASGFDKDEAREFLEEFEGSAPAGVKKGNIKEEDKAELAEEGARAAFRYGLKVQTAGDMVGTIAQHVNLRNQKDANGNVMTPRQALAGQIEASFGSVAEGRGSESTLIRGELAQAARAIPAGRVSGMPEMAAWIGTISTISKSAAGAGTAYSQISKMLNRQDETTSLFFQDAGADKESGDLNKLKASVKYVQTMKAKGGKDFDVNKYLATRGFNSDVERGVFVGLMGEVSNLETDIGRANARAADGAGAAGKNAAFQKTTVAENARSKNNVDQAQGEQAKKYEVLMIARRNAMARLERNGTLNDGQQNWARKIGGAFGLNEFLGAPPQLQKDIDAEVLRDLRQHGRVEADEATAFQPEIEAPFGIKLNLSQDDDNTRMAKMNAALKKRQAAGNGLGGDGGIAAQAKFDNADKAKRDEREKAKGMQPGAAPGAGAVPPVNVNAAALDKAAGDLSQVAQMLAAAIDNANNPFSSGLPGLGGGFGPLRS